MCPSDHLQRNLGHFTIECRDSCLGPNPKEHIHLILVVCHLSQLLGHLLRSMQRMMERRTKLDPLLIPPWQIYQTWKPLRRLFHLFFHLATVPPTQCHLVVPPKAMRCLPHSVLRSLQQLIPNTLLTLGKLTSPAYTQLLLTPPLARLRPPAASKNTSVTQLGICLKPAPSDRQGTKWKL